MKVSTQYPSIHEIDVMIFLTRNMGEYFTPVEVSNNLNRSNPMIRKILGKLTKENYIIAKPTKKGNLYKTHSYKMQYFLDDVKERLNYHKRLIN